MDHPSTKPPAKAKRTATRGKTSNGAMAELLQPGPTNQEIMDRLLVLESNERAARLILQDTRSHYQSLLDRLDHDRLNMGRLSRDLEGFRVQDRSPWQALKDWWAAW